MSWQIFDRLRAYFRRYNVYQVDPTLQDQTSLDKVTYGGEFLDLSRQNALLQQTNLQVNRLERYKDYDQMDEVGEITLALDMYCLDGDTIIPLLDGTHPTIKELSESGREEFWIYSYNVGSKEYEPARAYNAHVSGRDADLLEIIFDDGLKVKCTANHKILTFDGFIKAENLKIGQSVIPLYKTNTPPLSRKHNSLVEREYEHVMLSDGKWKPTHQWIFETVCGERKGIIHHKDLNKYNNDPGNLELMGWVTHRILHEKLASKLPEDIKARKRQKISDKLREKWKDPIYRAKIKIHSQKMMARMHQNGHAFRRSEEYSKVTFDTLMSYVNAGGDLYSVKKIATNLDCAQRVIYRLLKRNGIAIRDLRNSAVGNHKVTSIKTCGTADKVYDIYVDKNHCFAAGSKNSWIIVHNSDEGSLLDPEERHSIIIKAKSKRVRDELDYLFHETLLIDRQIRPIARYLSKYGDFASEIVLSKNRDAVTSLRFMNIYNFTRIATKFDDLVGFFYQDQLTKTPTLMHPWQVMHMRLTTFENIFHPYGRSILDGARKDFKRLRLMEDAALIYRICVRGDTRIRTPDGYKCIKDVKIGETAYCLDRDMEMKETKIVNKVCNGTDKIFRVFSRHREIYANATHPILVVNPYKKNGKFHHDEIRYVDVKDLKTLQDATSQYCHRFLLPRIENMKRVELKKPEVPRYARIIEEIQISGPTYMGQKVGLKRSSVNGFANGTHHIEETKATQILDYVGESKKNIDIYDCWSYDSNSGMGVEYNVPKYVDEDFARWFGFMIGDGFVSRRYNRATNNYTNEVGFALGDKIEINEKYKLLFEKIVKKVSFGRNSDHRLGAYYCYSKPFVEFMKLNGFVPGAKNKRIPNWAYESPKAIQEAFVDGYIDSDCNSRYFKGGITEAHTIECCNEKLVEDFKELIDRMGWTAGLVGQRNKRAGHIIDKQTGRKMPDTEAWTLYFTKKELPFSERILGVEEVGEDLVYDVTVENDVHNIIYNGIYTHQTRAPEKRIFSIPVGNIPPKDVHQYIELIARTFKKRKFVDPATGNVNERYSPLIQEDDFFLPKRSDGTGPTIDTLPGAENLDQIADIEYFKKKMISALKIPFSRVGIGEQSEADGKALSAVSPEFAKAIQWIQREMVIGLKKVAVIHLALKGFAIEDIRNFELHMTAASAIDELYRIETWASRAEIIGTLKETQMFPDEWILRKFTDLTEDEIKENERKVQEQIAPGGGEEEAPGGLGGGGAIGGMGAGPTGALDELGGEEEMGVEPEGEGASEGPEVELLGAEAAVDNDDKRLIQEFEKFRGRTKITDDIIRNGKERYERAFEYLLSNNELDGLPTYEDDNEEYDNVLVEWGVKENTRKEAIKEITDIIVDDSEDSDAIANMIGDGPQVISEEDVPIEGSSTITEESDPRI